MNKVLLILTAVFMTAGVLAQVPEKMSYQAVIRDASDALLTSTTVGMQISILQGSSSGTAVYVETQTPTTNANGLISIEVGNGTVVSGDFTAIDWSTGSYYIKSEIDPAGGTSYTITGASQLLSVPYALYAGSSVNKLTNMQTINHANLGFTEIPINVGAIPNIIKQLENTPRLK